MDPDKEKAISDLAAEVRDDPSPTTTDDDASAMVDTDDVPVVVDTDDVPVVADTDDTPAAASTDEKTVATSAGSDQAPVAPVITEKTAGGGRLLGSIALLLALAACAGSVYLWYSLEVQQRHEREIAEAGLLGDLKGLGESTRVLEKAQDKLNAAQGQLAARIEEKLEGSLATLQKQQTELTDSVSKIYESLDRSIDSWALEEVEQLLRMANHSVSLAGDVTVATAGLELADKRLSELGNPEYVSIRRVIAEEITKLKSVEQVDVPGLALRLSSLAAAVQTLPLVAEPDRQLISGSDEAAASGPQDNMWMEAGQALLSDLKGLVRIQNVTEAAKPLLTPEQRYFLIANLRLMLHGAQVATLRNDTDTYKSNLEQAVQWLKEYFDTENSAVQAMLSELNTMAGQDLTPSRPDISGSVAELQVVKSRMKSRMTLLFLIFIALALAAGFVMLVMQDPGYVLITLKPWSIELSLALFIMLVAVFFVLMYFLVRAIAKVWRSPREISQWRTAKVHDKARRLQTQGIMRVIEGDWEQAERHLLGYVSQTDTPALNYLGAAHAAHGRGDLKKRDEYLAQAMDCEPDQTTAIGLTKATLQYRSGQFDQANETLKRLRSRSPKNKRVLALSLKVLEQIQDWASLQQLTSTARKRGAAPAAEVDRLQSLASGRLLAHASSKDDLQNQWRSMSRDQRNSATMVAAYAERLIDQESYQRAEELLRKTINRNWDPELVRVYGRVRSLDPATQLKNAEKWAVDHQDSPELMLSLAQIALNNELWGKARSYLEACIGCGGTVEAYRELGHLLEQLDEKEQALDLYRKGIDQAAPHTTASTEKAGAKLLEDQKAAVPDDVREGELI